MADFLDLPTIIIIGVAIVVLWRLRSVLGTRTGTERPPQAGRFDKPENRDESDVVVPLHPQADPNSDEEEAGRAARKLEAELERYTSDNPTLRATLAEIAEVDPEFGPKSFQTGAAAAYEMVVTAFASGDRKALKELLDKDVYGGFDEAISAREAENHTISFTFVGLPNIEFIDAEFEKGTASITMRFDAEVVSATHDEAGQLVEGHDEQVANIADEWTFSRNTKSRDPNWKLVATNQLS